MSTQMDAIYAEQHRSRITHLYQARGFIMRGMTTAHSSLDGKKAFWPRIGKGTGQKKVKNQAATPMNAAVSRVSTDLETFEAFENVDKFDVNRIAVKEQEAQVKTGTMAIGRSTDYEMIDKISAGATKTGTEFFLDKTGLAFDLQQALAMNVLLENQLEGAMTETFCAVPPQMWANLLSFKQFTSADYIGPDLPFIRKLAAKTWNDINFVRWPKSYSERTAPDASNYDIFMFDKAAVGWANNFDLETYWTWDNKFGRWDLRLESEGAGIVIQNEGIITGRFSKTTSVAFN